MKNIAQDKQQLEYAALGTRGILSQLLSRFLKFASAKSNFADDSLIEMALNEILNNL